MFEAVWRPWKRPKPDRDHTWWFEMFIKWMQCCGQKYGHKNIFCFKVSWFMYISLSYKFLWNTWALNSHIDLYLCSYLVRIVLLKFIEPKYFTKSFPKENFYTVKKLSRKWNVLMLLMHKTIICIWMRIALNKTFPLSFVKRFKKLQNP